MCESLHRVPWQLCVVPQQKWCSVREGRGLWSLADPGGDPALPPSSCVTSDKLQKPWEPQLLICKRKILVITLSLGSELNEVMQSAQ